MQKEHVKENRNEKVQNNVEATKKIAEETVKK
jgi:hypothetical protein